MSNQNGNPLNGAPRLARKGNRVVEAAVRVGSGSEASGGAISSSNVSRGAAPRYFGLPVPQAHRQGVQGQIEGALAAFAGLGAAGSADVVEMLQMRMARAAVRGGAGAAVFGGSPEPLETGPFALSSGECRLKITFLLGENGRPFARILPGSASSKVEYVFELVLRESFFRAKGRSAWQPEHVGIEPVGFAAGDLAKIGGWGKPVALYETAAQELAMGFTMTVLVERIVDGGLPKAQAAWLMEHGLMEAMMATVGGDPFVEWFDEYPLQPVHGSAP